MTFSLVVTDPTTGHGGVAAMTGMPGVGKLVAHARARSGAAASRAMMSPYLAFDGLALIGQGIPADQALAYLVDQDPGREGRQFGLVVLRVVPPNRLTHPGRVKDSPVGRGRIDDAERLAHSWTPCAGG